MQVLTKPLEFLVEVEDAVFTTSPLPTSEYRELARKHTRVELVRNVPFERTDHAALAADAFARQVTGWRGLVGSDGAPLPFSPEARAALWEHDAVLCGRVIAGMDAAVAAWRAARLGN